MNKLLELRYNPPEDKSMYPHNLNAVKNLDVLKFNKSVTFFCGENGSGKSTIVEAIAAAWGFNPEGGAKSFNFETRTDSISHLCDSITLVRGTKTSMRNTDGFFLRAESFYNVATEIERLDRIPGAGALIGAGYGKRPLHEVSHGEAFFSLIKHRFHGNGLYILDEPEAALSVRRQYEMLFLIKKLADDNSQFIISTHSPVLLAYPDADIYMIDEDGIHKTEYEQTEQYTFMRDFINGYKAFTKYL